MTNVLHFYPNGEFTQGVDTSRRRKRSTLERACDALHRPGHSQEEKKEKVARVVALTSQGYEVGDLFLSPHGNEFLYEGELRPCGVRFLGFSEMGERIEIEDKRTIHRFLKEEQFTPLGLSDPRIFTENDTPRKKCLKMTSRMGRNIRNAAYIMEQRFGKDNLSFLTLTLPDLTPSGLHVCNTNWSALVDQFLKWLRSRIESEGGKFHYVYCTEVQPKRLKDRNEYALHLHLLFVGRSRRKRPWFVAPSQCRRAWVRCLRKYCPETFTDTALENLQRIKRSAGSYLSKYLSKGKNGFVLPGLPSADSLPVIHWGGMSRSLSREIKRNTRVYRGDGENAQIATNLTRCIHAPVKHPAFKFVKTSFIDFSSRDGTSTGRGIWLAAGCLRSGLHTSILDDLIADVTADLYPMHI